MKKPNGYAALLIIFVLGMASVLIVSSLLTTGYTESIMNRTTNSSLQAFYAANSGLEDAIYKIRTVPNYGVPGPTTFTLPVSTANAAVTVTGSVTSRQITSVGTLGVYARKIVATVQNTSVSPGFIYAIHANNNGIELGGNTTIKAVTGDGNVYSNGFIAGKTSGNGDCSNGSPSFIKGSAWAVTTFDKLAPGNGTCIAKDAYANDLTYCNVVGRRFSPTSPPNSCNGGTWTTTAAPTPISLPDMNIQGLKSYLINKGVTYSGTCTADNSLASCGGLTNTIGNIIITGNLILPSNKTLTVSGPVWVKGTITFNQNNVVGIVGTIGRIVVTDNPINVNQNISFNSNGNAYLLFISTYTVYPSPSPTPTPGPSNAFCSTPAITVSHNTSDVLFYATPGCIAVASNGDFTGSFVGEYITVDINSTITYDPNLVNAVFSTSQQGGWQIQSFQEQ